ncbi:MAG: hypothetical protein DKM22_06425 [Candidatus Melainabacteria bacterium]|nr:MAG: hypothetical protein DKM22_06425 [Candidatus Melainabacteria bacterium]
MKKSIKILSVFLFSSVLSTAIANNFVNDVKDISLSKNSIGNLSVTLTTDKAESLRTIKRDENEYVILLPETSSSKVNPDLSNVQDLVKSCEVKTQPYAGNIKGYTKITIRTTKPVQVNAKNVVKKQEVVADKKEVALEKKVEKKVEKNVPVQKKIVNKIKNTVVRKNTTKQRVKVKSKKIEQKPTIKKEVRKTGVVDNVSVKNFDESKNVENNIVEEKKENQSVNTAKNTAPTAISEEKTDTNVDLSPIKKSFYTSLAITAVLLLLLILLKMFNKKYANQTIYKPTSRPDLAQNENTDFQNEDVFTQPQEIHQDIDFENNDAEEIENVPEVTDVPEIVDENQSGQFDDVTEENVENNTEEPFDFEDEDLNSYFDEDLSVDDVFGKEEKGDVYNDVVDSNQYESNDISQSLQETDLDNQGASIEDTTHSYDEDESAQEELPQELLQEDLITDITNNSAENVDLEETLNVDENEDINEVENVEEQPEEDLENIVRESYQLTPTKTLYLADYDGETVLMASIKDEFVVLKKFDEIIDKPMIVRRTEKNSKKSTYIVRVGSFRGVVEVTMKSVDLVLEL